MNSSIKRFAILTLFVAILFVPAKNFIFAQGNNTNETSVLAQKLEMQINALLLQIQQLKGQLSALQTETKQIKEELKLTRSLYVGISGADVEALQKWLAGDSDVYPEGLVTGFYGSLTEKAVKKFQKKYGIEQAGIVGPKTREKIEDIHKKGDGDFGKKNSSSKISDKSNKHDDDDDEDSSKSDNSEHKLTVCHNGKNTLQIGLPAVPAHLSHGDTVGKCNGNDTTMPVISNIQAKNTTSSTTNIEWNTNEKADGTVWYSTTTPLLTSDSATNSVTKIALTTFRSIKLVGLLANTTYYYIVGSKDAYGNQATSTEHSITTSPISDTIAPAISNIQSTNITASTTNISWNTNENADSTVWYSTTTPFTSTDLNTLSATSATLTSSHDIFLNNLIASTTYYFLVGSKDSSNNQSTSTEQSFMTN